VFCNRLVAHSTNKKFPGNPIKTVHQINFKAGGSYKMSFINFSTGNGYSFGGNFLELSQTSLLNTQVSLKIPICKER